MRGKHASMRCRLWAVSLVVVLLVAGSFNAYAWIYRYDSAYDVGIWSNNGIDRLSYLYTGQQWRDWTPYGGWATLGAVGWAPVTRGDPNPTNFIGDGTWHSMSSGWSYLYYSASGADAGTWNYNGLHRFYYNYVLGQWSDHAASNAGYWNTLGGASVGSAFIGDGIWHGVNSNSWNYLYSAAGDYGTWHRNGLHRFLYYYSSGQWLDHAPSNSTYWNTLGGASVGSAFIGDGIWHNVNSDSWNYLYSAAGDYGTWHRNGLHRFLYYYSSGQWSDHAPSYGTYWSTLGVANVGSAFIGDGVYHGLWGSSDSAKYQYLSEYGYWSSSGVVDDDDFRFSYATGQWYRYSDGSTTYDNVSYFGNRRYVLTDYIYWTSGGIKSTTPTGSSYGTDVQYIVWNDPTNAQLASWYIFTPGTDLKWSGGSLQVAVVDNSYQGSTNPRWMRMVEQYTKQDVIVLEYEMDVGVTLSQILLGLGYVTSYYGKTIDDLAVVSHGNTSEFHFGDWITTSNYTGFSAQWATLNSLMANGGHFMLYHCETGSASGMLNSIASMTNTKVFANVNLQWDSWMGKVNSSYAYGDDNVWNANYSQWFVGASARYTGCDYYQYRPDFNFIDQDFEYQSDTSLGLRGYHMLFSPYSPAGYTQANMVYWWNNGIGWP